MRMSAFRNSGVTMVEMAIVLVIIGLLLGGLLMPLSAQMEQRRVSETQTTLAQIQEALIGFAIANGRLPCPATAASNGQEAFAAGGNAGNGQCAIFFNGFLPAVTLGITPIDNQGFAVDGWQITQNRIRYAVTNAPAAVPTQAFTRTGGMRSATMATLNSLPAAQYLSVCSTATGITPTLCGTAPILINNAVAVIYSVGRNNTAIGADQAANQNNNRVFVSHAPTPAAAPNGLFDDIVVWISPNVLYNRMVAAGMLP